MFITVTWSIIINSGSTLVQIEFTFMKELGEGLVVQNQEGLMKTLPWRYMGNWPATVTVSFSYQTYSVRIMIVQYLSY